MTYNHVCEDCGKEWESAKKDESCPSCGSSATQSNKQG
jgi:rubrerythrin